MNRFVAIFALTLVGVVLGLGVGQVTSADSASNYTDRLILRELKEINEQLDAIKYNTGAVCQDASKGFSCRKF